MYFAHACYDVIVDFLTVQNYLKFIFLIKGSLVLANLLIIGIKV